MIFKILLGVLGGVFFLGGIMIGVYWFVDNQKKKSLAALLIGTIACAVCIVLAIKAKFGV